MASFEHKVEALFQLQQYEIKKAVEFARAKKLSGREFLKHTRVKVEATYLKFPSEERSELRAAIDRKCVLSSDANLCLRLAFARCLMHAADLPHLVLKSLGFQISNRLLKTRGGFGGCSLAKVGRNQEHVDITPDPPHPTPKLTI